jgi:hypothetical protein
MNAYISDIQVCIAAQESFGLCSPSEFLFEMTGYQEEDFQSAFHRAAQKGLVNVYGNDTVLLTGKGTLFIQSKAVEDYKWLAVERVKDKLIKKEQHRRWEVQQLIKAKKAFVEEMAYA